MIFARHRYPAICSIWSKLVKGNRVVLRNCVVSSKPFIEIVYRNYA